MVKLNKAADTLSHYLIVKGENASDCESEKYENISYSKV